MESPKRLRLAYPSDRADGLFHDALEPDSISLPGYELECHRQPTIALNRMAAHGHYEATVISSILYPQIAHRYAILNVGGGIGYGWGPVLVGRHPRPLGELAGRPVGVGGIPTTGWFLLRLLCPEAVAIEMPCDRIAAAVAAGELEAGVLSPEDMLGEQRLELHCVVDLGAEWCQRHSLPLPIALLVVRRDLGMPVMQRICAALRRSLRSSLEKTPPARVLARRFARGAARQWIEVMAANEDSARLSEEARMGMRTLVAQVVDLGIGPRLPALDIIEGAVPMPVPQAA